MAGVKKTKTIKSETIDKENHGSSPLREWTGRNHQ